MIQMGKIKSLSDLPSTAQYLARVGAEPRTLKSATIKEEQGKYWRDVARILFSSTGAINAPAGYEPTAEEAIRVKAEFQSVKWPKVVNPHKAAIPSLPKGVETLDQEGVFTFLDTEGERVLMLQHRVEFQKNKVYLPWTLWDDGEWRCAEPEKSLPIWGLDQLKDHEVVFIHEGARSAAYARSLSNDHPWGKELSAAAHLGWIGGALNPHRTDWSPFRTSNIKRAYIVADNDWPGKSIVPAIAQELRCLTFAIIFNDQFPVSFDLGDDFPENFWHNLGGRPHYVGPQFRELVHPATWMTDVVEGEKGGRPTYALREVARRMWAYVEEADSLVCLEMPEIVRTEAILNKMLAPYSHTQNTCRLIIKNQRGRNVRLAYRPDIPRLLITSKQVSSINTHIPTLIRSKEGCPAPWLEFLEYLIPSTIERKEVERWCATLIACPEVRIGYGLLMVSERQGVGKTTLGEHVLAPLVGWTNVSVPSEASLLSMFNEWAAHKRLVLVNEIYHGRSWKAYNALKSVITDRTIEVNKKYVPQYNVENWCHIYACSNSMRALKMEDSDRRWFYPELVEQGWPKEKFAQLRDWLERGGLAIIAHWAEGFGDYIGPAEHAPLTQRKKDLIEDSMSAPAREAHRLGAFLSAKTKPYSLSMREIRSWIKGEVGGTIHDSDLELRKAMQMGGAKVWSSRIFVQGIKQYVVVNPQAKGQALRQGNDKDKNETIRSFMTSPNLILENEI